MNVHTFDPLTDRRWANLVDSCPQASVFHSLAWLQSLRSTYGYLPYVVTTCQNAGPLTNGLVFCEVRSWATGNRLVGVPFADHCEPLVESHEQLEHLTMAVRSRVGRSWRYCEIRSKQSVATPLDVGQGNQFWHHEINLDAPLEQIFNAFHRDSIQRKIKRAERESLRCEIGRSNSLIDAFLQLHLLTRRRHGLPPQPLRWFQNLARNFGDRLSIAVAFVTGKPIAAVFMLRHGRKLVYKYGGSDARFHHLGAMPFIFWRVIERAHDEGVRSLDLGRTDHGHESLATFKDKLGGARKTMCYTIHPPRPLTHGGLSKNRFVQWFIRHCPDQPLVLAGRFSYRHFA